MDTMLASNADAQLILKLYELRTEPTMRTARNWITVQFWPTSASEILIVLRAFGEQENCYLRQVVSYWEMAAALVLHGALAPDLFFDCNRENIFILAKFYPFLAEIRKEMPDFFKHTEDLTTRFSVARQCLEGMMKRNESRRAQTANR
jgi:hypothetical protein